MNTIDKDPQGRLLLSLLNMHTCIDIVYTLWVYSLCEGLDRMMGEIGVNRQVVVLAELLANIGKAGVNRRLAAGDVDQTRLARGTESFFPLGVGAMSS